jgi:hypothetical protein
MMKSRIMKSDWKPIRLLALRSALALIALAGIAPGVARAEDGSDSGLFGSMLKSLGIGGENNIEYRERPPLVVPPTRELPPPQTTATARDPNWPADPKAAGRKKGDQIRDLDKIAVPQRPAEPGAAAAGAPYPSGGPADTTAAIPPSPPATSGGFFGNLFSSSDRAASPPPPPAPARKSLLQPPPDFESPAPSQPYGTATPAAAAKATPEGALRTQPGAPGL